MKIDDVFPADHWAFQSAGGRINGRMIPAKLRKKLKYLPTNCIYRPEVMSFTVSGWNKGRIKGKGYTNSGITFLTCSLKDWKHFFLKCRTSYGRFLNKYNILLLCGGGSGRIRLNPTNSQVKRPNQSRI